LITTPVVMMKSSHILVVAAFLAFVALASNASAAEAYSQTHGICKAQCITWYYYWGNDGTLEYVMDKCSMGGFDSLKTLAKIGKGIAGQSSSAALGVVQDAIVCAITINAAIAPVFEACDDVCTADIHSYGPDIVPTELRYDEANKMLVITVTNGGNSYTNEIEVDVYTASTSSRDCSVRYGEMFSYYTIPELSPSGARYYEEGLSSSYTKRIPWEAPEDECSKIRVIVDPEEELPERYFETWGEANNVREEWVNNLPILPYYDIETLEYMQNGDSDDFRLGVLIKNNGEEMGWPSVTVEKCSGENLAYEETVSIEPGEDTYQSFQLDDLFGGDYATEKLQCIRVIVEDENDKAERTISIPLYSGVVGGTVYDMYGKTVTDATVTIDTGQSDKTDSKGKYKIIGVTRMGTHQLTAHSPTHEFDGHANVTFLVNSSEFAAQGELYKSGVDLVLMDYPGYVNIVCPAGGYNFYLDSGYFNYRGGEESRFAELGGVVPGNYTVMVKKEGYTTFIANIVVERRQETTVQCDIAPMESYQDDSGITFAPQQNDLWTNSLGEGYHLNYVRISGDGSTVAILAASSAGDENPLKLVVFTREGQKLADFVFPFIRFDEERGPIYPSMRISYDGSYILIGNRYIYRKDGTLVSENPEGSVHQDADLSADGAFVCHVGNLYSSSFTKLTQDLISGAGTDRVRCQSSGNSDSAFFTLDGSSLGDCWGGGHGLCRNRFGTETQIDTLDGNNPTCVAESDSGSVVVVSLPESGVDKGSTIYYLQNEARTWKKVIPTIDSHTGFGSILFSRISVTPAGGYIVALSGAKGYTYDLFVYDSQGNDLRGNIPAGDTGGWSRFYDARATGTGIYYVISRGEHEATFGVLGQPGQGQKQTTGGETELQDWEMGASGDNGLVAAGLAVTVFAFVMGFFAWKTGMLR
jgi:hypothetical protein